MLAEAYDGYAVIDGVCGARLIPLLYVIAAAP